MSDTTKQSILNSVSAASSSDLAHLLLKEFDEITRRFYLGDFRPAQLNGGRFSEVAFRICQYVCTGSHEPIGKRLKRIDLLCQDLENVPATKVDETFRIHIPRSLKLIYDFRNKRDVAHLGNGVSPNISDSTFVLSVTSWVLAEFVRIFHRCELDEAQKIVNSLGDRSSPLIWDREGIVRVLRPDLPYRDQALLLLSHFDPALVSDENICKWLGYSHPNVFRRNVLCKLHSRALIHYSDGLCRLLPPGIQYVQELLINNN